MMIHDKQQNFKRPCNNLGTTIRRFEEFYFVQGINVIQGWVRFIAIFGFRFMVCPPIAFAWLKITPNLS